MKRVISCTPLVCILMGLLACAGRQAAWDAKGEWPEREEVLLDEASLLASEGDDFWQRRDDKEQVRDALVRWEQAVEIDPQDYETYVKISQAYAFLASNHLKDEPESIEAREAALRAAEMAMMAVSSEFGERMMLGAELGETVEILGRQAVPAMYWYAVNLDAWLAEQSMFVRMHHGDTAERLIQRVVAVREDYLHAAPHRFLGLRYADKGDLDNAKRHFQRAVQLAPDLLENSLLLAEHVAVPLGDLRLFEAQMERILTADVDATSDLVLENERAQARARELLAEARDSF